MYIIIPIAAVIMPRMAESTATAITLPLSATGKCKNQRTESAENGPEQRGKVRCGFKPLTPFINEYEYTFTCTTLWKRLDFNFP